MAIVNEPLKGLVLIAFGYRARNGKDTCVSRLLRDYGDKYDIRRYAFGDEMKGEFYDALLTPLHPFWAKWGDYLKLPHPTESHFIPLAEKVKWVDEHKADICHLLQPYGTEFRRAQDGFYWVRLLRKRMETERPQIALISDLRFANELGFIKAFGGYAVKVSCFVRDEQGNPTPYLAPDRDPKHQSESELDAYTDHFDYEISVERGHLDELERDAVSVFEQIIAAQEPETPKPDGCILSAAGDGGAYRVSD